MSTATQVAKGGLGSRGPLSAISTGGSVPQTTTTGTDTTPVVTETYVAPIYLPANAVLTGVSLLNGSAVGGNVVAILYDTDGVPVAQSASTAQSGTAAYQAFAFSTPFAAQGPGRYFVGFQFNNVAARFRSHILGAFPAFKKTGETFGTATALTPVSTFTTGVGPIASTY
jgi:hypothetical protein